MVSTYGKTVEDAASPAGSSVKPADRCVPMTRCLHCGGSMLLDWYGEAKCMACGRSNEPGRSWEPPDAVHEGTSPRRTPVKA
jgi:hypothetical protein